MIRPTLEKSSLMIGPSKLGLNPPKPLAELDRPLRSSTLELSRLPRHFILLIIK